MNGARSAFGACLVALAASALPVAGPAHAQTTGYGQSSAGAGREGTRSSRGRQGERGGNGGGRRVEVVPYIEVDQIVTAELSPGNDVLTYTQAAIGADAALVGRNHAVSASVRYERQIGWGRKAADGDAISGIARGYATLAPGLTLEAGGLATQAQVDNGGAAIPGGVTSAKSTTTIWSVFAGPSFATRAGDIDVSANYRAGYTEIEQSNAFRAGNGGAAADLFDHSVAQLADVEAGVAPGILLPVGVGAATSYYQEDISNLDQRVRDFQVRGLVTVPVSRTVQAVGALGYEDVEISSRDALRGPGGVPVIGADGRFVTDKASPRVLAYDVNGLIWDVAVMWRPSRRTSLSAHVGRRYGSTSFGGTLAYAPDDRSRLSVAVYDNVAGFGGQLNRFLDDLPDDFEAVRDPVTGDLRGCVISLDGDNCLNGALGSVRSATFRARGVVASYSRRIGRLDAGIGLGYDRRRFIAARGTVLASANGVIDENLWFGAFISGELGRDAGWSANVYANWYSSSDVLADDVNGYGATAAYYRLITPRLRGTVAVSIYGATRDNPSIDDLWTASALAGLRYNF